MSIFTNLIKCLDRFRSNKDIKSAKKEAKSAIKSNKNSDLPEPKNYKFSKRSLRNLKECHPDIQKVLNEAIKYMDFAVIEGSRSKTKQDEYFAKGTSKVRYPNSYHNTSVKHIKDEYKPEGMSENALCSLAVDIVPTPIDWNDIDRFVELANIVKICAKKLMIPLDWGFTIFGWDYPHWQLTKYRRNK